jgi:hypothetical protein
MNIYRLHEWGVQAASMTSEQRLPEATSFQGAGAIMAPQQRTLADAHLGSTPSTYQ